MARRIPVNGIEEAATQRALRQVQEALDEVGTGTVGATGAAGATGATGPAGPAPAGTGFVKVTGGVLDVPSAVIAQSEVTSLVADLAAKVETASNVGGAAEVFKAKTGTDLSFRTIKAGSLISVVQNASDIEIASSTAIGGFYGDGYDGDVIITGAVTPSRSMFYNNLTIDVGAELRPNGRRIFVNGTLTLNGKIVVLKTNGGNGTAGAAGSGGAGFAAQEIGGRLSGGVGGNLATGAGLPGANSPNAPRPRATAGFAAGGVSGGILQGGGGGSGGPGSPGEAGGTVIHTTANTGGDLAVPPSCWTGRDINGTTIITGGSGGGGGRGDITTSAGDVGGGGGGGAGGGVILVVARSIVGSGSIEAEGGNGGNGWNGGPTIITGGGGGGGGGIIVLVIGNGATPTTSVAGGTGGAGNGVGGGSGGDGGSGLVYVVRI